MEGIQRKRCDRLQEQFLILVFQFYPVLANCDHLPYNAFHSIRGEEERGERRRRGGEERKFELFT